MVKQRGRHSSARGRGNSRWKAAAVGAAVPSRRSIRSTWTRSIMMDQMGEVDYAAGEPKGTPWHPHRGFETVTYIIDGKPSCTRTRTAAASSPTATPSG